MTNDHEVRRDWRKELRAGATLATIGAAAAAIDVAYAGRAGAHWSLPTFWIAQMLLFAAGLYGVIRHGGSERFTVAVIVLVALGTYLAKVSYSPIRFSFPDELQHLRSLEDLLAHRHLFYPNPSLSISPDFPGLEIVTDAVVTTTGLSPFVAGLVVAVFAHIMLSVAVYCLFRAMPLSVTIAGVATMIFATEPHFEYFDAIFAYQTLALPLFCLSLLGAIKLHQSRARRSQLQWAAVSAVGAAALLFTHHVTMLALLIVLAVLAVFAARAGSWLPAVLTLAYAAGTAVWFTTGAHGTLQYLGQPVYENLLAALPGHVAAKTVGSPISTPTADRVLAYAGVLCTLALLVIGWARTLRNWSGVSVAARAFALAALAYPVVLVVRLFAGDSSELAGRALTFALIVVAATIAPSLTHQSRWTRAVRRPLIIAVVTLMAAGGIATGWPPFWERIPGPFKIASFESGVDRQNVAVTSWAQTHLRANNRFASDFDIDALMGSIGRQDAELAAAEIFYSPRFTPSIWQQISSQEIRMFVIDRRMEFQRPADGSYFAFTPPQLAGAGRLPPASVQKFADSPRLSRVYDGGDITVYVVVGSRVT